MAHPSMMIAALMPTMATNSTSKFAAISSRFMTSPPINVIGNVTVSYVFVYEKLTVTTR